MTMDDAAPGPTWLDERNRRKAAEADEVIRAFDAVEARRLDAELTRAFVANGVGRVEPIGAEDRARVAAMLERDRAEKAADEDRQRAWIEVGNKCFVNLTDTVMPPTPEWLAKGETRSFVPRLEGDGGRAPTVKTVRSVRRVINPIVRRMHEAGKLGEDHFAACMMYRSDWDAAGVEGRFKTSNFSLAGNVGGGGGLAQHPMAQHEFEVEARQLFRAARAAITPFYLLFLDKVVLDDVPLSRAWRFARCPRAKAESRFRMAAAELFSHYRSMRREGWVDEQD